MEHYEKTLDTTPIYNGKIINLKVDTVELENGKISKREVVEHHGGVCVLAVDHQGCILFVSQFRYPFGAILLELPAGKLEKGEDPADCGRRELEEETGYQAGIYRPLAKMYPTAAYDTEIIHIYYASDLTATQQRLDPNEFLTVQKIPVEKAVQMVLAGEIPDGKTQLGILKYKALSEQGLL